VSRRAILVVVVGVLATAAGAAAGERQMVFPGETWQQAKPDSQGVSAAKLAEAVAFLKKNSGRDGVRELVIVRNGRMIHHGDNIDRMHGVWSLTKSFTSTVLGLLIDAGKCKLDTLAADHVPELRDHYGKVTLRHFTTMTSGYYAVGDEPSGGYFHGPSRTPLEPSPKPLFTPPGSKYAYWDSAMNEFGYVLTRIAGEPMERLFARKIADPIGMDAKQWKWGDFGRRDGLVVHGGSGNGNKHVRITARQLARFGHLFLHRGKWKGKQLVSAEWVKEATKLHVPASLPLGHPKSPDGRGMYGCNWWVNGTGGDGKRKWPGAPLDTYAAIGYNNNHMFVVPQWNLVVVRLGLDQSTRDITDETYGTFLKRIGQAMRR
jgi:CubicO group peptidase (beta-lactamase class C family)